MDATASAIPSPPHGRGARVPPPAICAAVVFVAGFGTLLCFWLIGDWPSERGLFHYRSATLGDALLLPLIVALLVAALRDPGLPPPADADERRWAAGAALLGLLLGLGTQALWLADDSPQLNWTIPRPHDFNAPGWWHAAFLSLTAAALTALAICAVRRVRAARHARLTRAAELAGSPWLAVLFGAALLFVGLIALDNADAAATNAGTTTTVALAGSTTFALAALALAFGPLLGRGLANLALAALGAGTACVLAAVGLPAPAAIAALAVLSAVLIAIALSEPLAERGPRWGRAVVATLTLLGGAALAFELAPTDGLLAAATLAAAALAALVAGGVQLERPFDLTLVAATCAYVFGVLTLGVWLDARPEEQSEAQVAVAASLTLLDALVFALVRRRFDGFMSDAQRRRLWRPGQPFPEKEKSEAPGVWTLIVALALPALLALAALLSVAAPALGTDKTAAGAPPGLTTLLLAVIAAIVMAAVSMVAAMLRRPQPRRLEIDVPLQLSMSLVLPLAVGCLGFSIVLLAKLQEPLHYPTIAAIAALGFGALTFEDIVASPVRLQLASPAPATWLAAGAASVAAGSAVFWLLTVGLWDGAQPASTGSALRACGITLLGAAILAGFAGVVNARGLPTPHITEQAPWLNALVQPVMYAALALVALALPMFVVGRVEATQIENTGLTTLASIGFLPSLLAIFAWVLGNNAEHGHFEETVPPPPPILDSVAGDEEAAETPNKERVKRLQFHVAYVNWLGGGLLVAGIGWAAVQVLTA